MTPGTTIKTKMGALTAVAENGVILDSTGNYTFASGNKHMTVWGVENDQWETLRLNRAYFDRYIEASLNINANTIAIHMPWAVIEPSEGNFATGASSYLKYCVEKARGAGLKIVVYSTSTNYASGDGTFVPSYIREDKEKYTRLYIPGVYDGNSQTVNDSISYCINDPDILERDIRQTEKLFEFIKNNNDDGIFVAVNLCSEIDYSRNWASGTSINHEVRCECANCNALYRKGEGNANETPYQFMLRTYNDYVKKMADAASAVYSDVALYTPVAALTWFAGGRYVEQPDRIKETVGRDNFFVCPSIAPTPNYAMYMAEMDYFIDIPGNAAFASGIDTGHDGIPHNNQSHLEVAPWYTIFEYGGLGAIYWDFPASSVPNNSVLTSDAPIVARLRTGWAPLKATEYYISRFKGDAEVLNWWSYEAHQANFTLGNFTVSVNRSETDSEEHENYGIALLMDDRDLVLAPTAYAPKPGENNDIYIEYAGGTKDYKYEKGYFDADGVWRKTGTFKPEKQGNKFIISVANVSGDYTKTCYRLYK